MNRKNQIEKAIDKAVTFIDDWHVLNDLDHETDRDADYCKRAIQFLADEGIEADQSEVLNLLREGGA